MAKAPTMPLKDCYALLDLPKDANLEDVKRAYRRRAFELHPDLNPHDPQAGQQFQRLNEAYVILSRVLARDDAESAKDAERAAKRKREAEKQAEKQDTSQQSTQNTRADAGTKAQQTQSDQSAGQSTNADAKQDASQHTNTGQPGAGKTSAQGTQEEQAASDETEDHWRKRSAQSAYASQENVLSDILSDPFARRVFEDIYSEVNKKQSSGASPRPKPSPAQPKSVPLGHGENSFSDLTHGLTGVLRNWLRSQIDEIQTMRFPMAHLFPGARLRFQIRRGISNELSTVEITLPKDFVIGKPVRLRGLGRRVGPWQGDLYLKLLVRETAPKPS